MASGCPVLVSQKSGIAQLFDNTKAMRVVEGNVASWVNALRDFSRDGEQRNMMRQAALQYSQNFLASWQDVLAEDLFPVWRRAASLDRT